VPVLTRISSMRRSTAAAAARAWASPLLSVTVVPAEGDLVGLHTGPYHTMLRGVLPLRPLSDLADFTFRVGLGSHVH